MIFDYPTLKFIWWLLVGVLLVGFAIMDGHHRWRGYLCRLAAGLCDGIFRILLGDAGGALGLVLPAGRFRLPEQD